MFKKPVVYVNIVLSLVVVLVIINVFALPGHTFIRRVMAEIGTITGTGTINYLPRFVGADATSTSISDSIIFDDSAGHIGVGTIAPTNVLTVQQSGNSTAATATSYGMALNIAGSQQLTLGADATYAYLQSWNAKPLYINSQGNNVLIAGNVGIGTTSPAQKLSVAGTIESTTGGFKFPDGTTQTVASKVVTYPATLAEVVNTAAKTAIVTFTVPANAWADGDWIDVRIVALEKNASAAELNFTPSIKVGSGSEATLPFNTWHNDTATEYPSSRSFQLVRHGNDVRIKQGVESANISNYGGSFGPNSYVAFSGVSTSANFASDVTVVVSWQFGTAGATIYYKPQSARIIHYK